jgi:indole-3-glycerol phosphate synthase
MLPDTEDRQTSMNGVTGLDKLQEICATKREEVANRKPQASLADLDARAAAQTAPRGFRRALEAKATNGFGLIAEIKKASPSKGLIRPDFHPADHARSYEQGGAACLSVLTDAPYFQGHEDFLIEARAACALPVLRKDFMVDPWQVAEARAIGADAILIIVAALEDGAMAEIEAAAIERGMDVLVEVHNEAEMERAAHLQSRLIGVNNRDLKRFVTDLGTTERLSSRTPEGTLLVSESGINSHDDLLRMERSGVRCFLVGESLMRQADVTGATRQLLGI